MYDVYESPIGSLLIDYTLKHITGIRFIETAFYYEIEQSKLSKETKKQLDEYFMGARKSFDLPLYPIGTEFQRAVWNELMNIPFGTTKSYKDIAEAVGNEKAYRAVGMANNLNPIAIIIPCHRVIGINGTLMGYRWGVNTKEFLLRHEKMYCDKAKEEKL